MNSSFLPGCAVMNARNQRKLARCLPLVARHLREQRTLAVHDFVVRDRQHELLGPRIHEREGDQRVVEPAVHGIERDVAQRVVHPAHVPLEVKAEPAEVRRLCHARKRRRLLGEGHGTRVIATDRRVQLAQEIDGFEIFATAEAVRNPLARVAAVIEIQHRGDCIHSQARRRGTRRASTARSRRGNCAPRAGRN